MENFLLVVQIIVLLSLSFLALYLVVFLMKMKTLAETTEKNIKEFSTRALPVLENMEVITSKLRTITENVDDQITIVRNSVQSIKTVTDNIVDFERRVQERIESPVMEVATYIGAISKGITLVLKRFFG